MIQNPFDLAHVPQGITVSCYNCGTKMIYRTWARPNPAKPTEIQTACLSCAEETEKEEAIREKERVDGNETLHGQ